MAHHVRTKKIAQFSKKDGHILKGKYIYRVECKRCGLLHDEKITSEALAERYKIDHHMDMRGKHSVKHPNDKAHQRVIWNKAKKAVTRGH